MWLRELAKASDIRGSRETFVYFHKKRQAKGDSLSEDVICIKAKLLFDD